MSATVKRVLILVEREDGGVATITLELLQAGRELADKVGANLCAAVLGREIGDISKEITHFADEVYSLKSTLLQDFQVELYTHALEQLCRKIEPDIVLMGHILNNLDLAPRLACKLGSKLITDCISLDIEAESGHLLCMKPVYGDNAIATFISDNKPQVVTLRPKVMKDMARGPAKGEVVSFDPAIDKSLAKIELLETIPGESVSLDKADVIVAGGRGIKKIEGLKGLKEIITVLKRSFEKVELGVSRPLVDVGWLPPSRQIGLTGEVYSEEGFDDLVEKLNKIGVTWKKQTKTFHGSLSSYDKISPHIPK